MENRNFLENKPFFDEKNFFLEDGEEDYEKEVLTQSIGRITSQMTKLSSIIVDTVWDDNCSGKFSSYPIDVAELARHSNESVPEDTEAVANIYEHITTDPEDGVTDTDVGPRDRDVAQTDPEVASTDPEVAPTDSEVAPTDNSDVLPPTSEVNTADPEMGTTSADNTATSVDKQPMNHNNIPPSPDGSTTFLEDVPGESEASKSTPRIKSKAGKMRSFFKRKTKKRQRQDRYVESTV
jgi:hypothetical protein